MHQSLNAHTAAGSALRSAYRHAAEAQALKGPTVRTARQSARRVAGFAALALAVFLTAGLVFSEGPNSNESVAQVASSRG